MIRWLLLSLFALAVVGCVPADPLSSYDPYRAAAVADAAIVATQQARARAMEQATLQSAQAKQETDLRITALAAEIGATQTAWAFETTRAAATRAAAFATAEAARSTEIAVRTATPAAATAAAIVREDEKAAAIQTTEIAAAEMAAVFWPMLKCAGAVVLIVLAWLVIRDLITWKVIFPNRVKDNAWGTVIHYRLPDGSYTSRFVPKPMLAATSSGHRSNPKINVYHPPESLTPSGSVWAGPTRAVEVEAALRLVEAAIEAHDDHELGRTIPRWDKLDGFNSETWQDVTNWMVGQGYITKQQGRATELPILTLGELEYVLLAVSPTLAEEVA